MKLYQALLVMVLTGCAGNKSTIVSPGDELKMVDPLGPSPHYNEQVHRQKKADFESVGIMPCLRSIYTGKTSASNTIFITRHCVEHNRGWFYAARYLDKNKDGHADSWCDLVGETVVGGIAHQQEWACYPSEENLDEVLRRAEQWVKDPYDFRW